MSIRAYILHPEGGVTVVQYETWPERRTIAVALGVESVEAVNVHPQLHVGHGPQRVTMYVDEVGGLADNRVYNTWASLMYQQASLWRKQPNAAARAVIYGPAMLMNDNHEDWLSTHQTDAFVEGDYIEDSRKATRLFEKLRGER